MALFLVSVKNAFHRETYYTVKRFLHIAQILNRRRYAMQFTNGCHRAFESLMWDRPGSDHYDSGVDGPFPECRTCRYHRPYRSDRYCHYAQCPYSPGRMTAISKGNPAAEGGDAPSE